MNASINREQRHRLLTSVSAAALLVSVTTSGADAASTFLTSSDRPPLWIDLGGGFSQIGGRGDMWMPTSATAFAGSASAVRKDPTGSFGAEANVSYQPDPDGWLFSAAVRYGRLQRHGAIHHQNPYAFGFAASFYDATSRHTGNFMIVDFNAGKDIGIGNMAAQGRSMLQAGIRIAQFEANASDSVISNPYLHHDSQIRQRADIKRSTAAMGPALFWNASVPLAGNSEEGLALDWGANAALLFGRQKMSERFALNSQYGFGYRVTNQTVSTVARSKHCIIPNAGGFAGISYRLPAAKIAIGYRADVFFDAVDGGIAAAHSINRSFYGPFASIAFGIGD